MIKILTTYYVVSVGYACCLAVTHGFLHVPSIVPSFRGQILLPMDGGGVVTSCFSSPLSCNRFHNRQQQPQQQQLLQGMHGNAVPLKAAPNGMHWFIKTETFCKPFPEVKMHLEAHRAWVRTVREQSRIHDDPSCPMVMVVSGYRVDKFDKPGGGGLMIFSAKDYESADEFVRKNDPLIINDCVHWQLNKWIAETGDITIE